MRKALSRHFAGKNWNFQQIWCWRFFRMVEIIHIVYHKKMYFKVFIVFREKLKCEKNATHTWFDSSSANRTFRVGEFPWFFFKLLTLAYVGGGVLLFWWLWPPLIEEVNEVGGEGLNLIWVGDGRKFTGEWSAEKINKLFKTKNIHMQLSKTFLIYSRGY